jgi:hypothetical protein
MAQFSVFFPLMVLGVENQILPFLTKVLHLLSLTSLCANYVSNEAILQIGVTSGLTTPTSLHHLILHLNQDKIILIHKALMVQPGVVNLNAWYVDSWASTYVIPDLNAFNTYSPYNKSDQLCVGDGKGLPILHTDTALLPIISGSLVLRNVLHVPSISKPLLSIS